MPVRPLLVTTAAAVAALTAAASAVVPAAAAPASPSAARPAATTNYTLVTEPADAYAAVDRFITSATTTLDMTMYELADTTASPTSTPTPPAASRCA